MDAHLFFTYLVESPSDSVTASASLCQEISTAQWRRPGIDEDFRPRFAAKVVEIKSYEKSSTPHLSSTFNVGNLFNRFRVVVAYPIENFGDRIPNILTAAAGEGAFFCHGVTSIKLIDIEFPDSFLNNFQGPQFGIDGIREKLKVYDRPIFFGVVKPNIGLNPEDFAKLAYEAWVGGLDIAKDDELLSDVPFSPFEERMRLVGYYKKKAEDRTGTPKIFIANITSEVDDLMRLHDIAVKEGVGAVMINVLPVGLSASRMVRKRSALPMVAHFDTIAALSRVPFFGISTQVFTKLQRIVGFDSIIMPGFGKRMMTPEGEVLLDVKLCTVKMGNLKTSLPVPGGSDWAGTLSKVHEAIGSNDFGFVPGRGVFGHPAGPTAGAMSLHQAWDLISRKVDLNGGVEIKKELLEAMEAFKRS